ncbi:aminoacyl-tRNA hydrolase [Actinopolymorpha alba]|uniref:aminoacyl-tRNA hydrolase n=1 Tax=Actinopolymorpha alba TaxID=533267 RepID=UPI00037B9696|nr:aminoacyl-tRNA hydrolase [Actinopolymorpha alba]
MTENAWLIVGLGNPGPTYAGHRHNVGQMVLDLLAERMGGKFRQHPRGRAEVVEGRLGGVPGVRVVAAKPRSYMNESGGPVASLASFYKLSPDRLVVVHDELDIPYATLRLKLGGGDNGHNGLRSIRRSLSTGDYYRVRCGVGRPPGRQDPADFVLSPFSSSERKELPLFVDRAADACEALLVDGLEYAQNAYHG